MDNERKWMLEDVEDILFTTIWSVVVNTDGSVNSIELSYIMDLSNSTIVQDYELSEAFIQKAKQQITNMEWKVSEEREEEQTAVCYLNKSNPDEPQCTNNLES